MRRVAVTGMGVVSPLGGTLAEAYHNASSGYSGIHRLQTPFAAPAPGAIGGHRGF